MLDDNQLDLNLAESAPMHLDSDFFDGLLDYAFSADAHDVDDSIVPVDSAADAPGDEDLDSIALADDAADPLDDADVDPAAASASHGGDGDDVYGAIDDPFGDLDDSTAGDGGGLGYGADLGGIDDIDGLGDAADVDGLDAGAVDGGDVDPLPGAGDADSGLEW